MTETKARFHLPGLRYNFPLNMLWISLLKTHPEFFREGVEIGSVFGCFPLSLWNGGRSTGNDQCDAGFVRSVIKNINSAGIPVRFTFNNPIVEEEDLDDPFCNFCMDEANNGMNEVIIVSPLLEEYLRKKYPDFEYNSSTCKEIKDIDTLNAEIDRNYKYVVLDYNLNGKWEFIDSVNHPEKLEILINPVCDPACPRRGEHYRTIAVNQKIVLHNRHLPPEKRKPAIPWKCDAGKFNSVYDIQKYPTVVKPDQIWEEYLPRGIVNFKIEGRTANILGLIDAYCLYMLRPECIGPARLLLMRNLEESHVITVNKPKPQPFILPNGKQY
ncbi:MAG: hypothetical protein IJ058_08040 [Lachnospiraceae bacterium]|nr:hypothetical protein [Lachnospiraceae bacterium]